MKYTLQLNNFATVQWPGERQGMKSVNQHGTTPDDFRVKIMNCTTISTSKCEFPNNAPGYGFPYGCTKTKHPWINAACIHICRGVGKYAGFAGDTQIQDNFTTADRERQAIVDDNIYYVLRDPGVPQRHQKLFKQVRERGSPKDSRGDEYVTLAEFKSPNVSAYTNSGNKFGSPIYGPKRDQNSVEQDPKFVGDTATIVRATDISAVPISDFRPRNGIASLAGLTAYGVGNPGYVGALDPNGDGTEIGPRAK
jgi:hypothetical protein